MRLFDRYTKDRFRQLSDGRTIFLPKGPDGPAYLVPDEATRERIERGLRVGGAIITVLAVVFARLVYFGGKVQWPVLLAIPLMLYVNWVLGGQAEHLQQIHDFASYGKAPDPPESEQPGWQPWGLVGGSTLGAVAGAALMVMSSKLWLQVAGAAMTIVCAWFAQLALQDVLRARQTRRERADWSIHGRTIEWSDSHRTQRRFF